MRALIFDCDGVLGETESRGHLVAFNRMWRELGVPWQWPAAGYRKMLAIGGGKERMRALFDEPAFRAVFAVPEDEAARAALLAAWHRRKSELYREIVESGQIPPRAGVKRLAEEALKRGWLLAVASTSATDSVRAMMRHAFGAATAARFTSVLGGEDVQRKKPDPEVYRLSAARLGVPPSRCVVIEDSAPGLRAALGAGMPCVITVSEMTAGEDFAGANLVVDSLGEPGQGPCVRLDDLMPLGAPRD
jgi:HAD superfamily hydrolase (TIGR01509 family)